MEAESTRGMLSNIRNGGIYVWKPSWQPMHSFPFPLKMSGQFEKKYFDF